MTTAYVTAICHSWIGCDPISGLELLTAHGRGSQSGGELACMQHPSLAICSKQHSIEPAPIYGAMMRIHAGIIKSTPSGCISVPGPSLVQSVPVPRTEHVNGRECMLLAVDEKTCMHVAKHAHANATSQCYQFKPLFSVGSVILARMSCSLKGQMLEPEPDVCQGSTRVVRIHPV